MRAWRPPALQTDDSTREWRALHFKPTILRESGAHPHAKPTIPRESGARSHCKPTNARERGARNPKPNENTMIRNVFP